jgi:sugar phosphate isomerase/epimerase
VQKLIPPQYKDCAEVELLSAAAAANKSSHTRRRFLAESATVLAGAAIFPSLAFPTSVAFSQGSRGPVIPAQSGAGAANAPNIAFPTAARERISVASYPFRDFITPQDPGSTAQTSAQPKMTLKEFAAHVVEKFKINKIEPWSPHFISQDAKYLGELRAAFDAAHVTVVNIAVDGKHSIYATDAAERERAIAESKSWIDVAVAVGSPSVRTHVVGAKDSGPNMERAAESLRHVAEYGASKNVVVNLENDDPVSEDGFFIGKLVSTVGSPWLCALPDFANSLVAMDGRQAYAALDGMFAEAYNICHVKSVEVNEIGNKFKVDMGKAFGILKHHNFKGFCSMEFDSPGDPYNGTNDLIKQTVQYLS